MRKPKHSLHQGHICDRKIIARRLKIHFLCYRSRSKPYQGFARKNGKTAKIKFFSLPTSPYCQLNQNDRKKVVKACENCEAAIALSCIAGYGGIRNALPQSFKVIPGMATVGTIASYLTVENGKVLLDKTKTKVIRFKQANQTA